jgi:hypothetical protein
LTGAAGPRTCFADIIADRFGLLTYRKNQAGKDIPDLDDDAFAVMTWTGDDGRDRSYDLADETIEVPVTSGTRKGETLTLRQVTRRDKSRRVHILTTIGASQLPAPGVACRMTGRWREENWFRYGRPHFDLDSLDSYAVTPDDPARMVPNPAKKTAAAAVKAAQKTLADVGTARQRKLGELRSPAPGSHTLITNAMLARLDVPVDAARRSLQAAQAQAKATPATAPSPSASASYQRRAAPELWPRSAHSSTPPRPATPAPSLSCATKSAPRPALHKRSPMSGVLGLRRGDQLLQSIGPRLLVGS